LTATVKFISTVDSKLSQLQIENGQLIFVNDTRRIYLDFNGIRTEYSQVILLAKEEDRVGYLTPINAFYFVNETKIFWRYEHGEWVQLTSPPKETVVFINYSDLPSNGETNVLYITETQTYKWNGSEYIQLGIPEWGNI
jgi:hypothetical protein